MTQCVDFSSFRLASPRSHGERPLLEGGDEKEVTEGNKLEYEFGIWQYLTKVV